MHTQRQARGSCEVCPASLLFTEVANLVELYKLGQVTCEVAALVTCRSLPLAVYIRGGLLGMR